MNKTNNLKLRIFLFSFLTTLGIKAQVVRSFGNDFMNIGVGAKNLALSKSVSSQIRGVESGYWNPAGLTTVQNYEFAAMHNTMYAGIANYDYFAVALPVQRDEIAASFSVVRLGIDNILNTTNLIDNNGNINYNNITTFNSADVAAYVSFSKKIRKNFDVGFSGKIISRNIGDFAKGNGFGFDVGAQYVLKNVKFGLTLRDITTTFTAWKIEDYIYKAIDNAQTEADGNTAKPNNIELTLPSFQLGVSTKKKLDKEYTLEGSLDLIGDFSQSNHIVSSPIASFSPNIGLELDYKQKAFLRVGAGNIQQELDFNNEVNTTFQPNVGIGFKYKMINIDYALTNVGASSGIGYSNIFSIKVNLNEYYN